MRNGFVSYIRYINTKLETFPRSHAVRRKLFEKLVFDVFIFYDVTKYVR